MQTPIKTPFYQKSWFILLMLLIFPPIGIFLVWKFSSFGKPARIVLTVISVFIFFVNFVGGANDVAEEPTPQTEATTEQPATPEEPSEPELTPEEQAALEAEEQAAAEAKAKEEAEAKAKAEEEQKRKAEEEAKKKAEEEQRAKEEAAQAEKQKQQAFANSTITYQQLEKGSDKYAMEPVRFKGEVIEINEDASGTIMRIAVTPTSYGYDFNDFIIVMTTEDTSDIYKDDIVTVDGYVFGAHTYESQAGWNITAPLITGDAIYK